MNSNTSKLGAAYAGIQSHIKGHNLQREEDVSISLVRKGASIIDAVNALKADMEDNDSLAGVLYYEDYNDVIKTSSQLELALAKMRITCWLHNQQYDLERGMQNVLRESIDETRRIHAHDDIRPG